MPELPEVETTRRGLLPRLQGRSCLQVTVRQPRLRLPVPADLDDCLRAQPLLDIERRAKYLLLRFPTGTLIIHLGMSGSLQVVSPDTPAGKHEHIDWLFGPSADDATSRLLRYRDPRRFGLTCWWPTDTPCPLPLAALGPEPLGDDFTGDWLFTHTRQVRSPIKPWLMDGRRVVGIGNIYAQESLFRAGIAPQTPAGQLDAIQCAALVACIRSTLADALRAGGSSLRDFIHVGGEHGWFQQSYFVYGREGEPCRQCGTPIQRLVQAQRATAWCPQCQPLQNQPANKQMK